MSNLVCIFSFVDAHAGTVAAIATIVIAAFTILLALSTHRLWKATRESAHAARKTADALYATERPYIHADVRLKSVDRKDFGCAIETKFRIWNYGRTPAIRNSIKMLHNFEPKIPEGPDRDVFFRRYSTGVLNKDKSLKDTVAILVKREDWKDIETREPTKKLFFLIRVDCQDVFGNGDIKDFWFVYKPIDAVWSVYKGIQST